MAILNRILNLFRAEANSLLDHVEDAEKLSRQAVADMEDGLRKGKVALALSITEEKKCQSAYEKNMGAAKEWRDKAKAAVGRGEEELAREAVKRALAHDVSAQAYKAQWDQQITAVGKLRTELMALESKVAQVRIQQELLVARKRRAEAVKQVNESLAGIGKSAGTAETFERMGRKVEHMEAEASAAVEMAGDNLEDKFAALGADEKVEAELAALKGARAVD